MKMKNTTISISTRLRKQLSEMKVHPRESYEGVIVRIVKAYVKLIRETRKK